MCLCVYPTINSNTSSSFLVQLGAAPISQLNRRSQVISQLERRTPPIRTRSLIQLVQWPAIGISSGPSNRSEPRTKSLSSMYKQHSAQVLCTFNATKRIDPGTRCWPTHPPSMPSVLCVLSYRLDNPSKHRQRSHNVYRYHIIFVGTAISPLFARPSRF